MLAPVLCVYLAVLGYYAIRTRALARANESFAEKVTEAAPPAAAPDRLAFLRKEQERLKSDIETIAELKATLSGLTNEVAAAEKKNSEIWVARSNELQSSIERERQELRELNQWSRNWERMKTEQAARKRLEEKALLNLDPAKEHERTGKILAEIARTTRERMELQGAWRTSNDKSPEARSVFQAKLQEINARWLKATQQLGEDSAIYERLPVKPDDPQAVVFRSVLPDGKGMSVTVLLDGTVEWSRKQ